SAPLTQTIPSLKSPISNGHQMVSSCSGPSATAGRPLTTSSSKTKSSLVRPAISATPQLMTRAQSATTTVVTGPTITGATSSTANGSEPRQITLGYSPIARALVHPKLSISVKPACPTAVVSSPTGKKPPPSSCPPPG